MCQFKNIRTFLKGVFIAAEILAVLQDWEGACMGVAAGLIFPY